jgi:hypothetical protein
MHTYLTDGFVVISMIIHKAPAPDMECNLSRSRNSVFRNRA